MSALAAVLTPARGLVLIPIRSGAVRVQYAGVLTIERTVVSVEKEKLLSIVEPMPAVSVEDAQGRQTSTSRSEQSRQRRRLSEDEALEIARLYGETSTPTSEIRQRFGIGESSLYRVVQRQGIALRGRTVSPTRRNPPRAQTPPARRTRSSSPTQARTPASQPSANTAPRGPRITGRTRGAGVLRASVIAKTPAPSRSVASQTGGKRGQFRILFMVERVVPAADMADALRQAESLGAIEIIAVTRQE
jgi:transposase-like protein